MNDIATKLRELADEIDRPQQALLPPNMGVREAATALAGAIKSGKLSVEISWSNWGKDLFSISYDVTDRSNYKKIAEAENLRECVERAIIKQQPADVLDKLDEMMPVSKEAVT